MFWFFILICDLVIPFAMCVGGFVMWKHCPKRINRFLGYRTERSMRNIEAWKFANENCGRRWVIVGLVTGVLSGLSHIPFLGKSDNTVGIASLVIIALELAVMLLSIIPTESALKQILGQ